MFIVTVIIVYQFHIYFMLKCYYRVLLLVVFTGDSVLICTLHSLKNKFPPGGLLVEFIQ